MVVNACFLNPFTGKKILVKIAFGNVIITFDSELINSFQKKETPLGGVSFLDILISDCVRHVHHVGVLLVLPVHLLHPPIPHQMLIVRLVE
jgi:hypothetical protein